MKKIKNIKVKAFTLVEVFVNATKDKEEYCN